MYIRCYSEYYDHWDDGIGVVVVAENEDALDKYAEQMPWKNHPNQTFYIEVPFRMLPYTAEIMVANELE